MISAKWSENKGIFFFGKNAQKMNKIYIRILLNLHAISYVTAVIYSQRNLIQNIV